VQNKPCCFFSMKCVRCVRVRMESASLTAGVWHDCCTPMSNYRSKYSSPFYHVQTIYFKHERQKYTTPFTKHIYRQLDYHIYTRTHKSESIYLSGNGCCSGKAKESWKRVKCFESNLIISRLLFPFDILDLKPVYTVKLLQCCFGPGFVAHFGFPQFHNLRQSE